MGQADYASLRLTTLCEAGSRSGPAGASDDQRSGRKIAYSVRTPANYDATLGHPLLMVYAPAGFDPKATERHADITTAATAAGFIVAYAEHRPLGMRTFAAIAEIATEVSGRWCVDPARVVYAGHSDGATTAMAVAFLGKANPPPAGVIASAAGIRHQDLHAYPCPRPTPILVAHSRDDTHFPPAEFGAGAARWWATCNRCSEQSDLDRVTGCRVYRDCEAPTQFCESSGPHARWPDLHETWLHFAAEQAKVTR
jgi:polyhydroxybutyrate depolymerase